VTFRAAATSGVMRNESLARLFEKFRTQGSTAAHAWDATRPLEPWLFGVLIRQVGLLRRGLARPRYALPVGFGTLLFHAKRPTAPAPSRTG
jgi:hypothetical protein